FELPCASAEQVAETVARVRRAQPAWAARPIEERVAVMQRWAAVVEAGRARLEAKDFRDTGGGRGSLIAPDRIATIVRAQSAMAPGLLKAMLRSGDSPLPGVRYETILKPYPVVGVISPWNAPTMLSMLRAIPPLFAGCCVVLKPSEVTPRFA